MEPAHAASCGLHSDQLTDRERAVLRLAGEGLDSAEIGERLQLSAGTVRNYLSEAIGKLGASNRIEAHRLAHQKAWFQKLGGGMWE